MATLSLFVRDNAGYNTFGLPPSDLIRNANLTANAAFRVDLPVAPTPDIKYWLCVISYTLGNNIYVAYNTVATLPPGTGSFGATNSELNPTPRYLKPGDFFSVITANTGASISVSLYGSA